MPEFSCKRLLLESQQASSCSPLNLHQRRVSGKGLERPTDCPLLRGGLHAERPLGAPMVSCGGACAAYWHYRQTGGSAASRGSLSDGDHAPESAAPMPLRSRERVFSWAMVAAAASASG